MSGGRHGAAEESIMRNILSGRSLITVILALSVILPPAAFAGAPQNQPTVKDNRITVKRLALGTVKTVEGSLLTVTVNTADQTVMIDDTTKITKKGAAFPTADIKTGMKVRISFIERVGKKVATRVEIVVAETESEASVSPKTPSSPPHPPRAAPLPKRDATRSTR
jgi:hypothetical protein